MDRDFGQGSVHNADGGDVRRDLVGELEAKALVVSALLSLAR